MTVVVSGVPGVGKTALAAWWLHQHREHFPGGQVYARLVGPDGLGETPRQVLGRWLLAVGVPAAQVPASQAGRARLWQSVTAGMRLAVMVDDGPSVAAAAALLPGPGPARVVITSRRRLTAGPAASFRQLRLRPLKRRAAAGLLARELGTTPADDWTAAAGEVVRACGGLPLALRCAARLAASSDQTLTGLAVRLEKDQARLTARGMPRAEARARAVIEAASRQLEPAAARAFRLLSLCPGPEISAELAAAVLDTSAAQTQALLGQVASAGLLERAGQGWWRFHDLAQRHAVEQAGRTSTGAGRRAVTGRMLTWYAVAAILAHPGLASGDPNTAARTRHVDSDGAAPAGAAAWVDRHQPALIAALRAAAARDDHIAAVWLAAALWPLLGWHGSYQEQLTTARLGVQAARHAGDTAAEARLLAGTGFALRHLGRTGEAAGAFRRAARIWLEAGRDDQLAVTLRELGHLSTARGRPDEAIQYFTQAMRLSERAGQEPGGPAMTASSGHRPRILHGGEPCRTAREAVSVRNQAAAHGLAEVQEIRLARPAR